MRCRPANVWKLAPIIFCLRDQFFVCCCSSRATKLRLRRPLHHASRGPPPPLSRGRMKRASSFSRCIRIRVIPSKATNLLPPNKKGGGAPIGAIQPSSAPSRVRQRADRRAPAFRRSTAALATPVATSIGSAPDPRFLRPGSFGRYPLSPVSSLPSTSETGRSAGRSGTQSRPGAVCETARGHRTRSTFRIASRKRPSPSK